MERDFLNSIVQVYPSRGLRDYFLLLANLFYDFILSANVKRFKPNLSVLFYWVFEGYRVRVNTA